MLNEQQVAFVIVAVLLIGMLAIGVTFGC